VEQGSNIKWRGDGRQRVGSGQTSGTRLATDLLCPCSHTRRILRSSLVKYGASMVLSVPTQQQKLEGHFNTTRQNTTNRGKMAWQKTEMITRDVKENIHPEKQHFTELSDLKTFTMSKPAVTHMLKVFKSKGDFTAEELKLGKELQGEYEERNKENMYLKQLDKEMAERKKPLSGLTVAEMEERALNYRYVWQKRIDR
jgi:hypothetical protein